MASSLDRIFAKNAYFKEEDVDEDTCTGSETETVFEEEPQQDSDSDDCYEPAQKKSRNGGGVAPASGTMQKGVERNPTRRPNPKVVNRNAVMARENRLRKKQHVENLEQEIRRLREERDRDQKALRKAGKEVKRLTRERDHLKAVIANKSGIMAVLKAVQQQSGLPMTSSVKKYASSCDEGFGSSPNPTADDNDDDLGLGAGTNEDLFGGLLPADELLSSMIDSDQQVITTEHNYFEHSNHTSLESGSGVCVHIVPGGRVSVEFCDGCALSAHRAWLEEEQER